MHGFPMPRHQADGKQEEYSDLAGTTNTAGLKVRREYAAEADLNKVLPRFGINPLTLREMKYGAEINDRLDLQQALYAVNQAKQIQVPEELRSKYTTWQKVLNAAETGEYQYDLQQLEDRKKEAEERAKVPDPQPAPAPSPTVTT